MSPHRKKNDLAIKILMFDVSKENIFNFIRFSFPFFVLMAPPFHYLSMLLPPQRVWIYSLHVSSQNFHLITLGISIVIPLENFWHQLTAEETFGFFKQRWLSTWIKMKLFNVSHTSRLFNFRWIMKKRWYLILSNIIKPRYSLFQLEKMCSGSKGCEFM